MRVYDNLNKNFQQNLQLKKQNREVDKQPTPTLVFRDSVLMFVYNLIS